MKIDADTQDASPVTLAAARAEFDDDVTYLDTAAFDLPLAAARSSYAALARADPSVVAVGSQVPVFAGLIAANLPDGSEVLTAPVTTPASCSPSTRSQAAGSASGRCRWIA
jgi:hypothetical protein